MAGSSSRVKVWGWSERFSRGRRVVSAGGVQSELWGSNWRRSAYPTPPRPSHLCCHSRHDGPVWFCGGRGECESGCELWSTKC